MSDKSEKSPIWGNLTQRWRGERDPDEKTSSYPHKRSLIEETLSVNMRDIRQKYGKPRLLKAADEGTAVPVKIGGESIHVYMTWTPHRLPGKTCRWSSVAQGNAQIWLICMTCKRKVRALYRNPLLQLSDMPRIGCRQCIGLRYASENSGKRKWWKQIVRPLRRLRRKREKLLALKMTTRVSEKLRQVDELIIVYTQRAGSTSRRKPPSEIKRRYRDVRLAFGLYPGSDSSCYL